MTICFKKCFFVCVFLPALLGCGQEMDFYASSSEPARPVVNFKEEKDNSSEDPAHPERSESSVRQKTRPPSSPFSRKSRKTQDGFLEEHFTIEDRKDLEILIVVDTSTSMDKNLKKMGANMASLLSHIRDKKWRMAFTSADHGDHFRKQTSPRWREYKGDFPKYGKFMFLELNRKLLKPHQILYRDTSEYTRIFEDTLTRTSGSDCSLPPYCQPRNEQPLRSLKAAFLRGQTDEVHQKFFKENTDTVAIIITDEDERREDPDQATRAEEVIQVYQKVFKGQSKRLFGFSISVQDKACFEKESQPEWLIKTAGVAYGRIVGRLADLTGGRNVSLCSQDYGLALSSISEVTRSLMHSLTLKKLFYIPETVQVRLKPAQPRVKWKLKARNVIFSEGILPGTKVTVRYQYEQ